MKPFSKNARICASKTCKPVQTVETAETEENVESVENVETVETADCIFGRSEKVSLTHLMTDTE